MLNPRILRYDDPLALELTAALKQGDADRLSRLLATDRGLACSLVEDAKGGGRSPLHLFADWPGHNPNPTAIVRALTACGADPDAPAVGMWHREAPLHWAASSDDVALIDALLDAGADIERPGSSINGGSPLSCAVGYGQWVAARRLVERGARTLLWHEAALGLMKQVAQRFETEPHPGSEEISGAFWNACNGGQLAAAQWLLTRGADLNWRAPWSGQTPLEITERSGHSDIAAWLTGNGAIRQDRAPDRAG
jgi:ankyrin repeat protein